MMFFSIYYYTLALVLNMLTYICEYIIGYLGLAIGTETIFIYTHEYSYLQEYQAGYSVYQRPICMLCYC